MNQSYQDVEARELSTASVEERQQYIWVDVRTDEEYEEAHIPDSYHIPVNQLEERIHELEPHRNQSLVLICRSGRRSELAAHFLAGKGFTSLFNLKGGMLEWTGPLE
ncbi:rhodanese-like domain-containing protein [Mechercharimyces sp. CAU 1602]|uniref:rhodanese-like domain-containing protein n=1 Tax=Mechercharimyces sp. CAU 1602 TaxID=2973933 RepID=UPI002162F643|nr:rhodanese-like domain-containing protein [Mechercharimyces sp. CAU 1602]MCS1350600.1 rhodanese-like domain-containing protein [Mechercharimyces sp. CAU 1602]